MYQVVKDIDILIITVLGIIVWEVCYFPGQRILSLFTIDGSVSSNHSL